MNMSFCLTRLDKNEKEKLKIQAKKINAKVTNYVEQCSHLIANKATATVKLLTALVMKIPIVTLDWLLSFTEREGDVTLMPQERE
jgi:NAD-dependent DNA ligase